jgi:hypothetical protein
VESQGVYYLNGVANADLPEFSGFAFSHTQPPTSSMFEVHLGGRERIKNLQRFVSILIERGKSDFLTVSASWATLERQMIARDGKTVIEDANTLVRNGRF